MANFNKVILAGNLTRDPEHRVAANGNSICKLGLAVNRTYQTRDGERREETTFVDVDAFGKQADVISKYLRKGQPILIEGRLKYDQWESDGQKRSKLAVVVENFQFLGGTRDDAAGAGGGYESTSPPQRSAGSSSSSSSRSNSDDVVDDDVPF